VSILLRVRAQAVAVLEVDPVVLDRLAPQLGGDPGVDRRSQRVRHVEDPGEGAGVGRVLVEGSQGERPQFGGGIPLEQVSAAVDHVDRLAFSGFARVAAGEGLVGFAQPLGDGVERFWGERCLVVHLGGDCIRSV